MTISAAQCRAARAMVEWSRDQLAEAAAVSKRTIVDFERGARAPQRSTLAAIQRALEDAGVRFTEAGVELLDKPPHR
ncbi:helix-turn-helix transcriptional regulator [Pararhodospirillum photometricum]|uniref:helix-turn-helix transcriptional regulator n=1 Tax=Pararhodospirillum photometricum TaxID=1084 RepID=UPI0006873A6D|nr:helix-turn-helix transcriptional regulator [Pararhodospirillum photometricum]